jgi:hypothetical protein
MKRYILSALMGAAVFGGMAQGYKVVVTTTDGEKHSFDTESVDKVKFNEAPVYITAPYLYAADYRTQDNLGHYSVRIATSQMDEYGEPSEIMGMEVSMQFVAPLSDNRLDPILPEGYYRIGNGSQAYTWDALKSGFYLRADEGPDGVATFMMTSGTVDVRRDGNSYDIRFEMTLMSGEEVNLRYQGEIPFKLSDLETDEFTEDINVDFTNCQGRFYGNWFYPFSTDIMVQLYNGTFDEKGETQLEGYWLNLPLYMPMVEDPMAPNQRIADGVYNVEPRQLVNYTNLPYTYTQGYMVDLWGMESPAGSYITYINAQGVNKRALITDGTVTVSDNGRTIVFDMNTATEGVHFTGRYSGEPFIVNFCDNDEKAPDMSGRLDKDYTLNFTENHSGVSYNLGDDIVPGINSFLVMLQDLEWDGKSGPCDYLGLELLCDSEILEDGTYTINNGLKDFTGLRGTVNPAGDLVYSWMADLASENPETGEQEVVAPIHGGTVIFETLKVHDVQSPGVDRITEKKITVNLLDDKGNAVTGEFTGLFVDMEYDKNQAGAPARKLAVRK